MDFRGRNFSIILGLVCLMLGFLAVGPSYAQMEAKGIAKAFPWRNIGPANMSGRISDIEALDNDFTFVIDEK